MKFLVLGHFSIDLLNREGQEAAESFGGIYHAVRTLSALVQRDDVIVPVFGVHADDREAVKLDLAKHRGVETGAVFSTEGPTSRVFLQREAAGGWRVCSKETAAPIPFERIRQHLDADAVLINMVSGFDITLETLDEIRMSVRGRNIPLHFDYHNLTLGISPARERTRRPVPDWRRWAFMIDTVQLNEDEIGGLSMERLSEAQTAGHLLTLGVKGVLVTRGGRGVTVYDNDHKHVRRRDVPGLPAGDGQLLVGCGDVFGAAFLFEKARGADLISAATAANARAAAFAQHSAGGTGDLHVTQQ